MWYDHVTGETTTPGNTNYDSDDAIVNYLYYQDN